MSERKYAEISYKPSGFVRYSNKIFPIWEPESWTVWENDTKGVLFHSYELAEIFQGLLEIKQMIRELKK